MFNIFENIEDLGMNIMKESVSNNNTPIPQEIGALNLGAFILTPIWLMFHGKTKLGLAIIFFYSVGIFTA